MYDRRVHDTVLKNTLIRTLNGYQYSSTGKYLVDAYNSSPIKRKSTMAPTPPRTPVNKKAKYRTSEGQTQSEYHTADQAAHPMFGTVVTKRKAPKQSGKPKVKVPKILAKQVKQILRPNAITGTYNQLLHNGIIASSFVDRQRPFDFKQIGLGGLSTDNFSSSYEFSPEYFVDVMSKLFNGKANGTAAALTNSNMLTNSTGSMPLWPQMMLHIKDSYTTFRIKNIGDCDVNLKLWSCEPRRRGAYKWQYTTSGINPGTSADQDGTTKYSYAAGVSGTSAALYTVTETAQGTNVTTVPTPIMDWRLSAIKQKQVDGYDISTNGNAGQCLCLYSEPTDIAGFRKNWIAAKTHVVLMPGQEYDYTVQGPKNFDLKFKNCFQTTNGTDATFMNLQPFMRGVCGVMYTNMRGEKSTTGVIGSQVARWTGGLLGVMKINHCTVSMPDQIGFRVPTTGLTTNEKGNIVQLSERQPRWLKEELPVTAIALTATYTPQDIDIAGHTEL